MTLFTPARYFIGPCLIVLAITSVYPVVYGTILTFFNWNWGKTFEFVGFTNYIDLFGSREFWIILSNTFFFAVSAFCIEFLLGFYLAVQVDKINVASQLIRTLLLTPLMISGIIVALMSKVFFDPFLGIVNYGLSLVGLGPSAFFGDRNTAMWSIIAVDVWWQTAFIFIIMLAGLQSLPRDPLEAARVEGASDLQIFWRIKLPLLKPLIYTVLTIRSIDTLKVFDVIFGTTGGGPGIATESVQTLAYRTAYGFLQISKSMTIMVVFSSVILLICLFHSRLQTMENMDRKESQR